MGTGSTLGRGLEGQADSLIFGENSIEFFHVERLVAKTGESTLWSTKRLLAKSSVHAYITMADMLPWYKLVISLGVGLYVIYTDSAFGPQLYK